MRADYQVEFLPVARRELTALPRAVQQRIGRRIRALAADPRPPGVQAVRGSRRALRIRIGDYRVVYQLDDTARIVTIVLVGHRRDVYRSHE